MVEWVGTSLSLSLSVVGCPSFIGTLLLPSPCHLPFFKHIMPLLGSFSFSLSWGRQAGSGGSGEKEEVRRRRRMEVVEEAAGPHIAENGSLATHLPFLYLLHTHTHTRHTKNTQNFSHPK